MRVTRDWAALLKELRAAGFTLKGIAHKAECDPDTLYNIVTGETAEPKHSVGDVILELHRGLCGHTAKTD